MYSPPLYAPGYDAIMYSIHYLGSDRAGNRVTKKVTNIGRHAIQISYFNCQAVGLYSLPYWKAIENNILTCRLISHNTSPNTIQNQRSWCAHLYCKTAEWTH